MKKILIPFAFLLCACSGQNTPQATVAAAEPAKAAPAELHAPEGILTQEETIADSLLTFSGRAGQTLERHSQNTAKHRA